jgi:hypothetical protein
MAKPRLYTKETLTTYLRQAIQRIESEADAPLSFDQDLLIEDLCQTLGVNVAAVLDYRPSNAKLLHPGQTESDLLFVGWPAQRQPLEEKCPS